MCAGDSEWRNDQTAELETPFTRNSRSVLTACYSREVWQQYEIQGYGNGRLVFDGVGVGVGEVWALWCMYNERGVEIAPLLLNALLGRGVSFVLGVYFQF